eukprot:158793-Chlamydomonas_euryale.AAC.13
MRAGASREPNRDNSLRPCFLCYHASSRLSPCPCETVLLLTELRLQERLDTANGDQRQDLFPSISMRASSLKLAVSVFGRLWCGVAQSVAPLLQSCPAVASSDNGPGEEMRRAQPTMLESKRSNPVSAVSRIGQAGDGLRDLHGGLRWVAMHACMHAVYA